MLFWAGVNEAGAQGGGWRGWLDKLSGPGEFSNGVEFTIQVFCYGVPQFKSGGTTTPAVGSSDSTLLDREWGGVDVACQEKRDSAKVNELRVDLWRVAVGFEFGQSTAAHNPLE